MATVQVSQKSFLGFKINGCPVVELDNQKLSMG